MIKDKLTKHKTIIKYSRLHKYCVVAFITSIFMKYFNIEHEVIINTTLKLTDGNPVEGQLAEYTREVTGLRFYQITENNNIAQVYISKDFITSLYNQIQEIENEKVQQTYFDTPF